MWCCIRRTGLGLVLLGMTGAALAQTERSGGGENQRIVQQYQQLAAAKTELEAQVATLKHDLDASHADLAALATIKKERDALKAHATAVGASIPELTAGKQAAEKNAEETKAKLNELVTRFRDTANELKQVESDRDQVRGQLRERSAAYDQCTADNLSLYELNGEVLNRYEHVGLFTRVAAKDPFVLTTRNRIENLVDEYRARALELRAKSASADGGEKGGAKSPSHP
jgi:chromosome segregation ATPase